MSHEPASRLSAVLQAAAARLEAAAVAHDAPREARALWGLAASCSDVETLAQLSEAAPAETMKKFDALLARRLVGEPFEYLAGRTEFMGLDLHTDARVLVPREDSEAVVLLAEQLVAGRAQGRVADLGTGSGCLLAAFLSRNPEWTGLAIDASSEALAVAEENFERLGLDKRANCLLSEWWGALAAQRFDLVLANPPYVVPGEEMGPGVAEYEPALALFTPADDPLFAYRAILDGAAAHTTPDAVLVFEVGLDRADEVESLAVSYGWQVAGRHEDGAAIERAVGLRRAP